MREIKFRAWHIEREKMFCVESLQLEDEYYVLNDGDIYSDAFSVKKSDIQLMQFIGIQDKSGREVYEGDIIQYGTPPTYQSSIFWSPQDFGFVTYNELLGEYTGLSFFTGYKNFKVIGNVHQNPELLEQNDE